MTRLHVPVLVRWSDLDAYQHVNNVAIFRLLEEARITAFWEHPEAGADGWPTAVLGDGLAADSPTFVARQEIEYLRPLAYSRVPVRVEMWIGHVGGASIDICYEILDGTPGGFHRVGPTLGGEPYVRATTTIAVVDADTQRPRRFTAVERTAWAPFVEPPIEYRRRRAGTS